MKRSAINLFVLSLLVFSTISFFITPVENSSNSNEKLMNSKSNYEIPHSSSNYGNPVISEGQPFSLSSDNGMKTDLRFDKSHNNNNNKYLDETDQHDFIPKKDYFISVNEGSSFHYYYGPPEQSMSTLNHPVVNIVNDKIEYVVKSTSILDKEAFEMMNSKFEVDIVDFKSNINAYVIKIPLDAVPQVQEELLNLNGIQYIEPHFYRSLSLTPNDPQWSSQWGPQLIGMESAWDTNVGNRSVIVAVIDTGIDYTHPELSDAYIATGYDWYNDDTDPFDDHYHGTHVSGTVAAAINNSEGVAGVANVSLIAEKIFSGGGSYAGDIDAAAAIDHAVAQGADILSNSWGGGGYSQLLADAVSNAIGNGSMFIAAAGNDATDSLHYPAAYPGVIAVSATDSSDNLASFSNYGDWIDIAAPGVDILSTFPVASGSYDTISGTSMATPHVSGLAALIMSQFPSYTPTQVEELLYISADDLGDPGFDTLFGNGRINASKAMFGLPDHELRVSHDVPDTVSLSTNVTITSYLTNIGQLDETNIDFEIYFDDVLVNSTTISNLPSGANYSLTYQWSADTLGTYNITSYTPLIAGELFENNNIATTNVVVVDLSNYDQTYPSFLWYDAQTNGYNLGMSGDDTYSSVNFPFNFTYYDQNFTTVYVSSNGWLSFVDTSPTTYSNPSFPTSSFPYAVAPLWDDLQADSNVYAYSTSDYVVIEYVDYYSLSGALYGTFAVVFYKYGAVQFLYKDINTYESPTVGLNYGNDLNFYNLYTSSLQGVSDFSIGFDYIPPEYETSVDMNIPGYIDPDNPNLIEATVTNGGQHNESNVDIFLYLNDTLVNSTTISLLQPLETFSLFYSWEPVVEGIYNFTVYSPAGINDSRPSNNLFENLVVFTIPEGRIGIVTAHGEIYPTTIADFYTNQGYLVEEITIITTDIYNYDLIIVTEGGSSWPSADLTILDNYLTNGSKVAVFGDSGTSSISWISNYGLSLTGVSANSGYTNYIQDHPLTFNVTQMYAGGPVNSLSYSNGESLVMDSANTYSIVGISSMVNLVVYTDDMRSYLGYGDNSIFLMNIVTTWLGYDHELIVTLEIPQYSVVNETSVLNTTVYNWGINNETNVNVSLYLDDVLVATMNVSELLTGQSYILNYNWTPSTLGTYNFTSYVTPVVNETITENNRETRMVDALDRDQVYGFAEITVYNNITSSAIQNAIINVYNSTGVLIDSGITDVNGFYNVTGLNIGSYDYNVSISGYYNISSNFYIDYIGEPEYISTYLDPVLNHELIVSVTAPTVTIVDDNNTITAQVFNDGLSNETNVEFYLYVNSSIVNNTIISELNVNQTVGLSYDWTPLTPGTYNITAYALPLTNETYTINNNVTTFTTVFEVRIGIVTAHGEIYPTGIADLYTNQGYLVEEITSITTDLYSYDLIIVTEGGSSWPSADLTILDNYFSNGGKAAVFGDSGTSSISWISTYGLSLTGISASSGYTSYIVDHPTTYNVTQMYAGGPVNSLSYTNGESLVMDSTNSYSIVGVSSLVNLIVYTDDMRIYYTSGDNSVFLMNLVTNWYSHDHELSVDLNIPQTPLANETNIIELIIYNWGILNETNVNVTLWIEDVMITSWDISEILSGQSSTLNYNWDPTIVGIYNITVYVKPHIDETIIENNSDTSLVEVFSRDQIYGFTEITVYNNMTAEVIPGILIEVYNNSGYLIDTGLTDVNGFYNVTGLDVGWYYYNFSSYGYYNTSYSIYIDYIGEPEYLNVYIAPIPQDMSVTIEAPSHQEVETTSSFSATFLNHGPYNVTDVFVYLYVNGSEKNSTIISNFLINTSYNLSYEWKPLVLGKYNITAYIVPVNGETFTEDNIAIQFLYVVEAIPLNPGDTQFYINEDGLLDHYSFMSWAITDIVLNGIREVSNQSTGEVIFSTPFTVNVLTGNVSGSWMDGMVYWGMILTSDLSLGYSFPWLDSTAQILHEIDYTYNGATRKGWIAYSANNDTTIVVDKKTGILLDFDYSKVKLYDTNMMTFVISPSLSEPADITYYWGESGNYINWLANDDDPDQYSVYKNGNYVSSGDYYDGETISINVDGNGVGTFNYTIVIMDKSGNTASDTVFVTVMDKSAPIINDLKNTTIEFGSTGNVLEWTGEDPYPDTFVLYEGDNVISEGKWTSNITINIDGFGVGTYYLTLIISDVYGNQASDWVVVYVVDTIAPTTVSLQSDMTIEANSTGYELSWEFNDPHPGIFVLFVNETEIMINAWDNETPITFSLDNIQMGTYNFTIVVQDNYRNTVSHSATVTAVGSDETIDWLDSVSGLTLGIIGAVSLVSLVIIIQLVRSRRS